MATGRWLCGVALLAACARWADGAPPGYVDPAVCAQCHGPIAESFSRTGMSRTFRSVGKDARRPELESASYDHAPSGEHFLSGRRDGKYYIRRTTTGGGQQSNPFEVTVDYVMGSGDRAVNYLHRTRDNQLVEIPIAWYAENGGKWGRMPPSGNIAWRPIPIRNRRLRR
jgi:hypothetical protein